MSNPTLTQLIDLKEQVAIVTGGAKGIGRSVCLRLAEAGAAVIVADVDVACAEETVRLIQSAGGRAIAVEADAASVADAEKVAQLAVERFGRLDILVNNAGIFPMVPTLDVTESLWDKVIDINLKGTFFYTQAAARRMSAGGRIVNVASIDGFHPTPNLVHYDASKGGVVMMTKSLALALGQGGIRVNCVAPGGVSTPGAAEIMERMRAAGIDLSNVPSRAVAGRNADPDEIARAVLFLSCELSAYMMGETIIVDGGYLLN